MRVADRILTRLGYRLQIEMFNKPCSGVHVQIEEIAKKKKEWTKEKKINRS